jgi:hypothetical protein
MYIYIYKYIYIYVYVYIWLGRHIHIWSCLGTLGGAGCSVAPLQAATLQPAPEPVKGAPSDSALIMDFEGSKKALRRL